MTRFLFTLLLVALPSVALAQTAAIEKQINADLDAIRKAERTEDIEVLRRILNKSLNLGGMADASCAACHDPQTTNAFHWQRLSGALTPSGTPNVTHAAQTWLDLTRVHAAPHATLPPFDAVYLSGHGVVFTLKVPASTGVVLDTANKTAGVIDTCLMCHKAMSKPDAAPSQAKVLTEWDRARDELRGVKPNPEPQPAAKPQPICEPGKLTERVVEKLWANAKNVRHLPVNEHVTVVVTFDGHTGTLARPANAEALTYGGAVPKPKLPVPERTGFSPEEVKLISLGDLHLKQNKPKEAAEAFEQALTSFRKPVYKMDFPAPFTPQQAEVVVAGLEKGVRDVYQQLAKAYLALNDAAKALAALEMARDFRVERIDRPGGTRLPVPAKLVLTAPRTADDEAAFRKAVKVELTGFPPPKP